MKGDIEVGFSINNLDFSATFNKESTTKIIEKKQRGNKDSQEKKDKAENFF
jgi:hypothetical protein